MAKGNFESFFNKYFDLLTDKANRIVNNKDLADEIASHCLLKFWDYGYKYYGEAELNDMIKEIDYLAKIYCKEIERKQISYIHLHWNDNLLGLTRLPRRTRQIIMLFFVSNLSANLISFLFRISETKVYSVISYGRQYTSQKFTEKVSIISNKNEAEIIIKTDEINTELIKYLAKHQSFMYELNPQKFENLIVALLKDMGYEVVATPRTRDGGRDILAVITVPPNNKMLTIIECKRQKEPIGIDTVRSFLFTLREDDKANAGWIVSASSFTRGAREKQREFHWLLTLNDGNDIKAWCSQYGKWEKSSGPGGLWLPNDPLA